MRSDNSRKLQILEIASSRLKRASTFAARALSARRQDVLAANCLAGQQCYAAVTATLRQPEELAWEDALAGGTFEPVAHESFRTAVVKFISEPAQRVPFERLKGVSSAQLIPHLFSKDALNFPSEAAKNAAIAQLAWGVLSLKKVSKSVGNVEKFAYHTSVSKNRRGQLSLQDLSIIECAIQYQDHSCDYSFMSHLSADGANTVHRVTMIIAGEYGHRVDVAIVTAAKILVDPHVGGDSDYCCSVLKGQNSPSSWIKKYHLD